nr:hypothetical protein [Tanacetum cinerariifolium]
MEALHKLILPVHRIRRWRYNLTLAESKFKTPMLDHQDKYMTKAQVHVSKSFAISDVQVLPLRKHYCQIYQVLKHMLRRRLLASFQDHEHEGGDTRSQDPVAPEVRAAAVVLPVGVLELDTRSSSEADPSESSPPPIPVAPMVLPFLCLDDSESDTEIRVRHVSSTPHDSMLTRWRSRVALRSSSPTTSTLENPNAPILPVPSAIAAPSFEFPLAPVVASSKIRRRRAILIRPEEDILSPLSLYFDFVFMSEIFKSLSFSLDRLFHLAILCLDQHAHTLHHLESLLTISLDRLDILKEDLCISEFAKVFVFDSLAFMILES